MIEARPLLEAAATQGNLEAAVESANLLRATGHQERALQQLTSLLPSLQGELRYRALRWMGVCEEMLGIDGSWERVEEARMGYLALGDAEMVARLNQSLSVIYNMRGRHTEALQLLQGSLVVLESQQNRGPYLSALSTLADLQMESRLYQEAQATIARALRLAREVQAFYNARRLSYLEALAALLSGNIGRFLPLIKQSIQDAEEAGDLPVVELGVALLADHHSRMGDHAQAIRVMTQFYQHQPSTQSVAIEIVEAMLARRRGDLAGAYQSLMALKQLAVRQHRPDQAVRAGLQAVYALYKMRHFERVSEELPEVLQSMMRLGTTGGPYALRPDMAELSELFLHAQNNPVTAPLLVTVLDQASGLLGATADLFAPIVMVELLTLGQYVVLTDGVPSTYAGRQARFVVAVLSYITLHPDCSNLDIQTALFPNHHPRTSARYIRDAVDHIDRLGPLLEKGGSYHRPVYRITDKVTVSMDLQLVFKRAAEGNALGALDAYRGEFMPELDDSEWVQDLRHRLTTTLKLALEPLLNDAELNRQYAQVVRLCTLALRALPLDLDLMTRRLQAAELSGSMYELELFRRELERSIN
ncbi:bacterial transcriptional activator domain-containing protein [Deinococcus ruber]|nr:bacterial transcriptional activator domain-containing protein [Deinococcus ruber]